jgi:hypothetical protein
MILGDLPPQRNSAIRTLCGVFQELARGQLTGPVCPLEFATTLGWRQRHLVQLKDALDVLESIFDRIHASGAVSRHTVFTLFDYRLRSVPYGETTNWCKWVGRSSEEVDYLTDLDSSHTSCRWVYRALSVSPSSGDPKVYRASTCVDY